MKKLLEELLDMMVPTEQVMAFELDGFKASLHKTPDNEYVVTNSVTQKALFCLGWEQAHWIFNGCVAQIRLLCGLGPDRNDPN